MVDFTQLGMGGILAILILREVFGYLRGRNGTQKAAPITAGEQTTDFWKVEMSKTVNDALEPYLKAQAELLRGMAQSEAKIHEGVMELVILTRQLAEKKRD